MLKYRLSETRAPAFSHNPRVKKHLRLVEELPGIPAAVEIEQIVDRQRPVIARREVLGHQLAVAIEPADAGNEIGTGCRETERSRGQGAGRQHVVAVEPEQDVAGRQRPCLC